MQKLVIDRQRWLRGEGVDDSFLLRPTDCKMCCLGFYCLLLGVPEDEISSVTTPSISSNLATLPELDVLVEYYEDDGEIEEHYTDSEICLQLTQINDTPLCSRDFGVYLESEQRRELEIAQLFREHLGVEVEFIN